MNKFERDTPVGAVDRHGGLRSLVTSAAQRAATRHKPCGHDSHVGTCPGCQRAQLERWNAQLAEVA
jgi:hypothetical protein